MKTPEEILMLEWGVRREIREDKYKIKNGQIIELDLSNSSISDISSLASLKNLKKLHLVENKIRDISKLGELVNLCELDLSSNQISDISHLRNLLNLTKLNLSDNKIGDISALTNLINLKELNLSYNVISDILPLSNLVNLNRLDLIDNKINNILEVFVEKIKLDFFYEFKFSGIFLEKNPLNPEIKQAIESNGREGLLAYYDNLKKGKKPFNEAKLIFLGEPFSGKTSLMEYLLGKVFIEKDRVND